MQKQAQYSLTVAAIVNMSEDFPLYFQQNYIQKDEEITELHVHDKFEIGYCYEGSGIFVVENKVIPFSEGDVCVLSSSEITYTKSIL